MRVAVFYTPFTRLKTCRWKRQYKVSADPSTFMKPRVIFCSADEISKPCLEFLYTEPSITFCGIVTQPQRAKGRGQTLSLNPIAQWAQIHDDITSNE